MSKLHVHANVFKKNNRENGSRSGKYLYKWIPSGFTSRKLCYDGCDHVWAGNDGHNSPCPSGQSLVSSQAAETDIYCNKLQSSPILLHRWKILNDEEIYFRYWLVNRLAQRSISTFIVFLQFSPRWPRAKTCIISIRAIVSIPPETMMYIRDTLGPVMTRSWHQASLFHYTRIWHIPSSSHHHQALTIFSLNVSFHLIDCKMNFLKLGY